MDVRIAFRNAVRRKTTPTYQSSVLDNIPIGWEAKQALMAKFKEDGLRTIIQAHKDKSHKTHLTNDELAVLFEFILDEYMDQSIDYIIKYVVGAVDMPKKYNPDDPYWKIYIELKDAGITVPADKSTQLPGGINHDIVYDTAYKDIDSPTFKLEKIEFKKPIDLYKGLKSFVDRKRIAIKVPLYMDYYLSEEIANYVAFKHHNAMPFDEYVFKPRMELPCIFGINPIRGYNTNENAVIVAPYKLAGLFKKYSPEFIRKAFDERTQREIRVAATRLIASFIKTGQYVAILHNNQPPRLFIPDYVAEATPANASLKTDMTGHKVVNQLRALSAMRIEE
jgi:hypothetical protein